MEYKEDYRTNHRELSDSKWMDLLRDRYNTNFLSQPKELIPVSIPFKAMDTYLKKKDPGVTPRS